MLYVMLQFIISTGISSDLGAKLRDWAVRQAGGRLLLLGSLVLK